MKTQRLWVLLLALMLIGVSGVSAQASLPMGGGGLDTLSQVSNGSPVIEKGSLLV